MKFVLVSDIEDTGMDVYGADADACVAEEVAVLPNGLVAIDVGGNTYVVNPSVIHSTNDSSPAAPLSTPADKFADADGNFGQVGDAARVRLSRLDKFGVNQDARNGYITDYYVSQDKVAISLSIGARVLTTQDFRWNHAPESTPIEDADGNTRPIGSSARLRLSRLSAFNISKAGRNGVIKSVSDDGTLVLAFDTGLIAVTVGRSDFRWN
jgi:hypothetical protein